VADLAVLPFRVLNAGTGDITPDGGGLAYMIAGELARNPDRASSQRSSTTELRGKDMSLSQIGATTHARYLVDGSVERAATGSSSTRSSSTAATAASSGAAASSRPLKTCQASSKR